MSQPEVPGALPGWNKLAALVLKRRRRTKVWTMQNAVGLQAAFSGSLREKSFHARNALLQVDWRLRRSGTRHPASCRMRQAGSLRSPIRSRFARMRNGVSQTRACPNGVWAREGVSKNGFVWQKTGFQFVSRISTIGGAGMGSRLCVLCNRCDKIMLPFKGRRAQAMNKIQYGHKVNRSLPFCCAVHFHLNIFL